MINLKPKVVSALEANEKLVSLLGGKRVYQGTAPKADEFPRITFFEMNNYDTVYADNAAAASEIQMQIDIWHTGSTSACAAEVDRTMKQLGFGRTIGADLDDHDGTKTIYHKALRYKITVEIEEE